MAPHHTLALKAVGYGADKIPDKAFEKIPLAGPRLFKPDRDNKKKQNSNQNQNDSDSNSSSDSESDHRNAPRRRRQRRQRRRERDYSDRGYESDRGTSSNMNYFPPPPKVPINGPAINGPNAYAPYNPSEYASPNPHQSAYSPANSTSAYPPPPPSSNYGPDDPHRRSSVADRYRPAGYPSEDMSQRGSSPLKQIDYPTYHPPDSRAVTIRPPEEDYAPYPAGYPPEYADYDQHHGQHHRHDSESRSDRSQSRGAKIKEELKQHKDVGVSALGALAGGIIGNELSRKHGKVGMLVGAALGGIGANVLEKKHEKEKQAKERPRRHRDDDDYGYDSY